MDAKDIYISNNYIDGSPCEYNLRDREGEINIKRFINTLDYSLDLIKLREVYEKAYRRTDFSFYRRGKEYTKRVINVTFKYSNKPYNRVYRGLYVKFGYNAANVDIDDCACVRKGVLIAIKVGEPVEHPLPQDVLGKWFYFDNGVYNVKDNMQPLNTVAELREELYENGFTCDGVKYVRYKRSSGSSRVGKCLFIDEKLYRRMHLWEMCGIKVRKGQEVDLAALESYISLTSSSIIDTLEVNAENILVIDDYDSKFRDKIIAVREKDGWLDAQPEEVEVANSIWDGQSLMDKSLFGKYADKGMVLMRNRFFKSCCFNCNLQEWFADNGITDVSQLNGFTLAKDIKDVKLVTTPNSIKYLKFGSLQDWLWMLEPLFGVVKYEKPTHFFDGRMVRTHYQLLNTLQMTCEEVDEFLQPSLKYLWMLKSDPVVLRYHIIYPEEENWNEGVGLATKNDIVYKMLGINERFTNTRFYRDFRKDLTVSFSKELKCGHVLVEGNYSTMVGNPIEMLQQSIGKFDGTPVMQPETIHTIRFPFGKELLGSRSPHVTVGNILLTNNVEYPEITKYLNLTNEIVVVNSINENLLNRLSGSDFDSDTIMLTNNEKLIAAARRNYNKFLVPTGIVQAKKKKRRYTAEEKADLDIKTSVNKIGEVINLSQELNTMMWDALNNGVSFEDVQELYNDVSKLDVLSNLEIDKAKKEYTIDSVKEIKKIKSKYCERDEQGRQIKPNFFGVIARGKGYYNSEKKNYLRHDTTMDYVQRCVCRHTYLYRADGCELPFSSIVNAGAYKYEHADRRQVKRIISLVEDYQQRIKDVWSSDKIGHSMKFELANDLREECVDYISKIKLNNSTMYMLLRQLEVDARSGISRMIFNTLFAIPNESFYDLIIQSKEPFPVLVEDPDGDINIYGFTFSKQIVACV